MEKHFKGLSGCRFAASSIALISLSGFAQAEILKNLGDPWNYLFFQQAGVPADPAEGDMDFLDTWNLEQADFALDYDGPGFLSGNAPLGYGDVPAGNFPETNVFQPGAPEAVPSVPGQYALYLRTTLNPTEGVGILRFTGVVDDGVIVYVNGTREVLLRVPDGSDSTWNLEATGLGNERVETVFQTEFLNLPAGEPVDIAVSLHNDSSGSDLAWDVEIESFESTIAQNDDFENAVLLPEVLNTAGVNPAIISNTSDGDLNLGVTLQPGEPNHNGDSNPGGSIWYQYSASGFNRRIWVSLAGSDFNTILSVYTGDAVNALTPVKRFRNWPASPDATSSSDAEPFAEGARVEFDALAGETYWIAVSGVDGDFGETQLTYGNAFVGKGPSNPDPMDPERDATFVGIDPVDELLPSGSSWEFLLYGDPAQNNEPDNPALADSDFYGVNGNPGWQTASGYDGPTFGMAAAPLGYGNIDALKINNPGLGEDGNPQGAIAETSNIWGARDHNGDEDTDPNSSPPIGARYTAYFRTTFTPSKLIEDLAVYGLIDDGAVIYINGEEKARINIASNGSADDWQLLAETPRPKNRPTESNPQAAIIDGLSLPAGQPVEVAVSLHNLDPSSSDMALDLQIFEQAAPAVAPPMVGDRPVLTLTPTATPGQFNLAFAFDEGLTFEVQSSTTLRSDGAGAWSTVTGANGGTVTENSPGQYSATVTFSGNDLTRFYRVSEVVAQ